MGDTFQAVMSAPVKEYVGGELVDFPLLEVGDYLPWCAELKLVRRRTGEARLNNQKITGFERFRAERWLEENEPTLDEISALVRTPAGGQRVLTMSLVKAGRDKEDAARIAAAVPPYKLANLASDVSQLFPPMLQSSGEGGNPNPTAGEPAGEQTGLG